MSSSENGVSKSLIIWLTIASIFVVAMIVIALLIFIDKEKNKGEEFFDSGSIVMTYAENSNIFFINNMNSVNDEVGKENTNSGQYYDFTIKIDLGDSTKAYYDIVLKIDEEFTTALPSTVKVYLEKQESGSYVSVLEPKIFDELESESDYDASIDSKVIARVSSDENTSHNYRLRMWLADGTPVSPEVLQSFGIEINVYGKAE